MARNAASSSDLTSRERDVLQLLVQGFSYAEIGSELGVSLNTVRTHIRSIYAKLDVCSKVRAVTTALRRGLVGNVDIA